MIGGLLKLGPWAVFEPSTETPLLCKGHQPVVWSQPRHRPSSAHTNKHTQAHIRYPSVVFQGCWVGVGGWLYYSCCNTDLIQGRSDPSSFFSTCAPLDHVLILHSPHEWRHKEELHSLLPHTSHVTQVQMLSRSSWWVLLRHMKAEGA